MFTITVKVKDEYTIGCEVTLVQILAIFASPHGLMPESALVVIIIVLDTMNGKIIRESCGKNLV